MVTVTTRHSAVYMYVEQDGLKLELYNSGGVVNYKIGECLLESSNITVLRCIINKIIQWSFYASEDYFDNMSA